MKGTNEFASLTPPSLIGPLRISPPVREEIPFISSFVSLSLYSHRSPALPYLSHSLHYGVACTVWKKKGLHVFFNPLQHFYFAKPIMQVQFFQMSTVHEEGIKFTRCFMLKEQRAMAQGGAGWRSARWLRWSVPSSNLQELSCHTYLHFSRVIRNRYSFS